MYTADLETIPGKIVNQKCRRLPTDRFIFAKKALDQLTRIRFSVEIKLGYGPKTSVRTTEGEF